MWAERASAVKAETEHARRVNVLAAEADAMHLEAQALNKAGRYEESLAM